MDEERSRIYFERDREVDVVGPMNRESYRFFPQETQEVELDLESEPEEN